MNHDRPMLLAVVSDVGHLEALRKLEVHLNRRHLPGPTNRISRLNRNLGTIKGATTGIHDQINIHGSCSRAEGLSCLVPLLIGADCLFLWFGREFKVEVIKAVIAQKIQNEGQNGSELGTHLLFGRKDVGVILGHSSHSSQTMHYA